MVAVNNFRTAAATSVSYSKTTVTSVSFSAMFASGMSGNFGAGDLASAMKSGDMDNLEQLYNMLTGQTAGVRSGVTPALGGGLTPFALLLNSGKIDMTRVLNQDSTGDHILTGDEIAMLREKYDVTNLTDQQQYDLMCELSDLNVLTADDAMSVGGSVYIEASIIKISSTTVTRGSSFASAFGSYGNNLLEQMMATLCREREDFAFMDKLSKENLNEGDLNYSACQRFSLRREEISVAISRHEKVANVLQSLAEKV